MTDEKRFYLDEEDRLCIHYDGKILASVGFKETEAIKIVDMLNSLNDENEQLRNQNKHIKLREKELEDRNRRLIHHFQKDIEELKKKLKTKEEEEKLYAKEILRLNELDKQKNQLIDILGGY